MPSANEIDNDSDAILSMRGAEIPVTDIPRAIVFYTEALGMEHISNDARQAVVAGNGFIILLKKRLDAGVETNIFFGTNDPARLHRHLINIGIPGIQNPVEGPMGLCLTFKDIDGNILHALEMPKH